jgi:dGTPase
VGQDTAEKLQQEKLQRKLRKDLLDEVQQKTSVGIEKLLEAVAIRNSKNKGASLQAVAVELFDLLQWGELKLTGADITKPQKVSGQPDPQLPQLGYMDKDRRAARNKRDRPERNAGGVRRSESRIDRDRILQSWAFRRLEGVTQIVTPDQSGHLMHSRLTHSMKVAQVGRRIADELLLRYKDKEPQKLIAGGGLDPDVVEAAGFAHDIGHPPFGHSGEKVLDAWAIGKGLRDGFEGNAQSLRAVTQLEFRFSHVDGMNLTNATRAAIIKYPWERATAQNGKKWEKFNAYDDDYQNHLVEPRSQLGVYGEAQTLEASIMDIADDITYALHDVEDFYTAGIFPRNQVALVLEDYKNRGDPLKPPTTNQHERLQEFKDKMKGKEGTGFDQQLFDDAVNKIHAVVVFSMYRHFDGSRAAYTLIRTAFASLIDSYISAIWLDEGKDKDGNVWVVARLNKRHYYEIELLKWLTGQFVHERTELVLTQLGQARLLLETLNRLFHWSQKRVAKDMATAAKKAPAKKAQQGIDGKQQGADGKQQGTDGKQKGTDGNQQDERAEEILCPKLPVVLDGLMKEKLSKSTDEKDSDRHIARAVVDYIASLTDAQVVSLARTLSGADRPSSLYSG